MLQIGGSILDSSKREDYNYYKYNNQQRFSRINGRVVIAFKLGSGCNLGKDLSKSEIRSQLVKHKDT